MKNWLLRYEASDFDNSLFDSSQLSAIRGASLTFLYSSRLVQGLISKQSGRSARAIYAGASQGAFSFEATRDDAMRIKASVCEALRRPDPETGCHQHMSYVVAVVEGADQEALSRAEALCNAQAGQTAHPAWPTFSADQTKPGSRRDPRPAQARKDLSSAIEDRAAFGRRQRQAFYRSFLGVTGQDPGFDFSDEFEEITRGAERLCRSAAEPGAPTTPLPLSLHNKMAVFFADGNAFGKHRDHALARAPDLGGLTAFSTQLIERQQQLLSAIISWLKSHYRVGEENAWFTVDPIDRRARARFETLMWGGDEMLFVLPSWLAFEFAELFFSIVRDWSIGGHPLTFSAGMVVCDRKTPISQAKAVAEQLSTAAKAVARGGNAYGVNTLQVEIFEGLALPDGNLDGFRDKLYFHGRPAADTDAFTRRMNETNVQLTIQGDDVGRLAERIARLQTALPRSQLYKLLDIGSREGVAHSRTATTESNDGGRGLREEYRLLADTFDSYLRRAGAESGLKFSDLGILAPPDGKPASLALNIAMMARLWDYALTLSPADPVLEKA